MITINNLKFIETSFACPEQYDVMDYNGRRVGYVRLRYGSLSADYYTPDGDCTTVYLKRIGDGWTGCFENDKQRTYHLTKIAEILGGLYNNPTISRLDDIIGFIDALFVDTI